MEKYKKLMSNTLIFTVSSFASKLLVFFMLPIYTRFMTTESFGASDLITTTVGLFIPIFTLSISSGVLRFSIDNKSDKKQIFSFGLQIILIGFVLLILAFPIFYRIDIIKDYILLFYLMYITSALQTYLNQFARGIDEIKLVGVCGVLGTVVVITSNVIFLVVFHYGAKGYLISYILSYTVSSIVLFFGGRMYQYLSIAAKYEHQLKKEMLHYSIPLAPNSFSWWLNNTANRYIISAFCGVSQVGLFSAASKIPAILITLQGIFQQAWLLSAISEYEKEDTASFFTKIYKYYNLVMVLGCSILIVLVRFISNLLLSNEYYAAWQFIPFLLISVVFGALSGFLGTIYSASKKNNMQFITTFIGGVATIIFNFLLVPKIGALGASISSTIAYILIWLIRLIDSKQYLKLNINYRKDFFTYLLVILQAIIITYVMVKTAYLYVVLLMIVILYINISDIIALSKVLFSLVRKKLGGIKFNEG